MQLNNSELIKCLTNIENKRFFSLVIEKQVEQNEYIYCKTISLTTEPDRS
jgi:hypothetical protein